VDTVTDEAVAVGSPAAATNHAAESLTDTS
jgi:hypothetical protein